jgi:hypothetical protein
MRLGLQGIQLYCLMAFDLPMVSFLGLVFFLVIFLMGDQNAMAIPKKMGENLDSF